MAPASALALDVDDVVLEPPPFREAVRLSREQPQASRMPSGFVGGVCGVQTDHLSRPPVLRLVQAGMPVRKDGAVGALPGREAGEHRIEDRNQARRLGIEHVPTELRVSSGSEA